MRNIDFARKCYSYYIGFAIKFRFGTVRVFNVWKFDRGKAEPK